MADIIELLPDHVANQIAAGEVVQRPASVVKELLENAVDAGASTIKLIIKDGGKTLVQVIDDGKGMTTTDARLCFERHATSKIKKAEDLFSIKTKGFRGEALASIAAISQVRLRTKTEDDDVGTEIAIEGSEVKEQQAVAAEKGCSLAVKNLFYNIPARRNFLKSDNVEQKHIIDEFQRVALVHHQIRFEMYNNDTILFQLEPSNMRQRIVQIFGRNTNEKLVPVNESTEILKLNGFVFKPEFAKKSRQHQFFFVNDRFIKSSYMHHAVLSAFEGLLGPNMQPGYILHMEVPTESLDVNIHPTKTEVKFEDDHALYAIIRSALKHSLGQFNVVPALDFDRNQSLDVPVGSTPPESSPRIQVDPTFNPFDNRQKDPSWNALYDGIQEVEFAPLQEQLFEGQKTTTQVPSFQYKKKYIVTSNKSGLIVIHQARAHQRVLYESLTHQMKERSVPSQSLAFPICVPMNQEQLTIFEPHQNTLELMGFMFGKVDQEVLEVTAIHNSLSMDLVPTFLSDLLEKLANEPAKKEDHFTHFLAQIMSKYGAIRSGTTLHPATQTHLIDDLFSCAEPDRCPNGKPIFVALAEKMIQNKFTL
ncbi:MAG: DNA mismatch repair endonuclease MutL [Flavobacteriaceae bacterium]|nr:DNA mismatch repair endonuclease MutL [Flavobacteriaceae bacterium]MDG0966967.1 DNA mismatch repair endonuclease MutL [Flavobacteriaceae bacterium]